MEKIDKSRFAWVGSDPEKREGMARPSVTYWKDAIGRLKKNRVAMVCLCIIILLILSCVIIPWVTPFDSREQHLSCSNKGFFFSCVDERYEGQNLVHVFGTDRLGRDLLVRTFEGGRVSLMIAFAAVAVNLVVGMIYGGISGYFGGLADNIMMRIVEVINGIPYMIIVVLLMMVLPQGIFTMVIAYATTGWTGMARLVRGQCLSLKNQEFVVASEAMGAKAGRIIGKHLLPNALSVIIINVTLAVPSAIFTEAFLSYIGLGVPVPQPSWGMLAQEGASVFQLYPHQLWIPAIAISLTMLSFNLLGDGLRDAFDPAFEEVSTVAKNMKNKVLDVNDLHVSFDTHAGEVQAVRGVSFRLDAGEMLTIVGESGCGKSVTAQTIMKLNPCPPPASLRARSPSGHRY